MPPHPPAHPPQSAKAARTSPASPTEAPFFAALERMFARSARPAPPPATPPAPTAPRRIGPAGLALIQQFEHCARQQPDGRFAAYPDPGTNGAPWTIGWGATGPDITRGTVWTQAQCDARLAQDVERCASEVAAALGPCPTSQAQFDALTSFHYNTGAIARATLTRLHKAGQFDLAAREFRRWNRAGGKALAGLTRRREAEAALYGSG